MGHLARLPVADDQVRAPLQNGPYELGDMAAKVLVVAVGGDDGVSGQHERAVNARREAVPQAAIGRAANDMTVAALPGCPQRAIRTSGVNDEHLPGIHALDLPGNILHRWCECVLLVEARDLY